MTASNNKEHQLQRTAKEDAAERRIYRRPVQQKYTK